MSAKSIEIILGHKIYYLLPRGEDGDLLKEAIIARIEELLIKECRACADIALAIDSGRGNEKLIAKAILERRVNNG